MWGKCIGRGQSLLTAIHVSTAVEMSVTVHPADASCLDWIRVDHVRFAFLGKSWKLLDLPTDLYLDCMNNASYIWSTDPTAKTEWSLVDHLRELRKEVGSETRMYGLPEVHKPPLTGNNNYFVQNFEEFVQSVRAWKRPFLRRHFLLLKCS